MRPIRREWLEKAYHLYVTNWLWDKWGYSRGWRRQFPAMVVWYAKEGSNQPRESVADAYAEYVRRRRLRALPDRFRRNAEDAGWLIGHICGHLRTNPVDWFTGGWGDLEGGWRALDMLCGIGPKIASFILRDLSFLRDYSDGAGGRGVTYRDTMNRRWFDGLSLEDQALFVPIDRWVHEHARRCRASALCVERDVRKIQSSPAAHREAATEIARWTRERHFDPRDLDVYWFSLGAGDITEDGTPTA